LTNSSVPAENFPFCTIDPSEARVVVPQDWFEAQLRARDSAMHSCPMSDLWMLFSISAEDLRIQE